MDAADDKAAAAGEEGKAAANNEGGARVKNPIQIQIPNTEERSSMIKSYTVYMIHINDFGHHYQIERRFDDFSGLHAALIEIDAGIPPIPEKKMWASTDAQTVAERRPAFEKILRYMLRSEQVVMEKGQTLWKFLEMPPPGVVAARYMFKTARLNYARQFGKLLDPKYEKEHAFRLAHESVIKTNLHLLTTELAQIPDNPKSKSSKAAAPAEEEEGEELGEEASEEEPQKKGSSPKQEAEAAALEMLRWALANGSEASRKVFLEEQGMSAMLALLFKKGKVSMEAGQDTTPDPRIRTVLNALVKAEGEIWSRVFAEFLSDGGVELLSSVKDIFQHSQGFAEFFSKLLWIAWDPETQKAFVMGSHAKEALGLLNSLFVCPSRPARTCAGLLLSCLIASRFLGGKEAQAAAGVQQLLEELVASAPAWTKEGANALFAVPGKAAGEVPQLADKDEAELTAFIQNLGQTEGRFLRIVSCAESPWRLNDNSLPDEDDPLWACSGFAFWCLLKLKPKPARLAALRPALPAVAQSAPARVRWLVGELLLMLQLQCPARLVNEGEDVDSVVETTFRERAALEVSLREQVEHSRQGLKNRLDNNQRQIQSFKGLTEERQRPFELMSKGPGWHDQLDGVINNLTGTREKLTGAVTSVETSREKTLNAIKEVFAMDLGRGDAAEDQELERKLAGMREIESTYLSKKQEFDQHAAVLKEEERQSEAANASMEQADKTVQDTRKNIMDLENQISGKQRDAQSKRMMASSDFSARKGQISSELEDIKAKQAKIREKAVKIQAGEPLDDKSTPLDATASQEEMSRLKQESAQLKARSTELQAEQSRMDVDPATLEQQAREAEEAVHTLGRERDQNRASLQDLEASHAEAREIWQAAMRNLQTARHNKEMAERECSGLKSQLDTIWAGWQPLWSKQLQAWRGRVLSLSQAQQGTSQLAEAVERSWESLRSERDLRRKAMLEVQQLQQRLNNLYHELESVDDATLEAVLGEQ